MDNQQIMSMLKPVDSLSPEEEKERDAYNTAQEPEPERVWDSEYLTRNIATVRDTMKAVRGSVVDEWDDEEVKDKYLLTMRGFESGNSIATLRMLQGMVGADDDTLKTIGEGIKLFDEMPSAFSEGAGFTDKTQAVGDYARSILLDPANLIGLGVGKLAVGAGSKTIGTAAKVAGTRAMRAGGEKAADAAFKKAVTEAGKATVEGIAQRTAQVQTTSKFGKLSTSTALKEGGVALATDLGVGVTVETARQVVRRDTGAQEDFQISDVAVTALATMMIGGAAWGSNFFRGTSGWTPTVRALNEEADAGNVLQAVINKLDEGDWAEKVARGKELGAQPPEFWIGLMDAMLPAMEREGYVWSRRSVDDKVSNWIADVIKTAEPEDARIFAREWSEKTGIPLRSMDEKGLEEFADTFAYTMNQSAMMMNRASLIARRLGKDVSEVTMEDVAMDAIGEIDAAFFQRFTKAGFAKASRIQNNIIRLIVSNLSTTRLNLVGYGASTTINTLSDVTQAMLYGAGGHIGRVLGKEGGDSAIKKARVLKDMQWQKAKNFLDSNTTLDQFLAYTQMRPNQLRELTSVLQGGIEDPNAVAKNFGVKPGDTVLGAQLEAGVDFIQRLNFVQAQDIYTKSQEFLYHMDKKLRIAFDRTMGDIMTDPDLRKFMADPRWAKAEAEAVYETQRAIYSQSFRRSGAELGRLAAFIEDFRNIPGLGLLIPFGRFFNNVVATTMDMSGASIIAKGMGYQPNRSYADLASRAAVSWTFVSMLAEKEREYIERGLDVFESENARGEIEDNRYTYPLSLFKGVARLVAYHRQGEEPPQDLKDKLLTHFNQLGTIVDLIAGEGEVPDHVPGMVGEFAVGQLTRDLTEASQDLFQLAKELLTREKGDVVYKDLVAAIAAPGVAAVSGATRFLEPLNVMVDLLKGANMEVLDPKDGSRIFNETFRYIDNFLSTSQVERYDAASGKRTPQLDKYFADRASKLSNTERILNMVGIRDWTMNEYTDSPEANNIFVKYFHSFLEHEAEKLLSSEKFRKGDLETRKVLWGDVKTRARDNTKRMMELKAGDEPRYKLIVDLNKAHSKVKLARAMEALYPEGDISDLNMAQLKLLKAYLDNRDDFIRARR